MNPGLGLVISQDFDERDAVVARFQQLCDDGSTMIIPVAALVETGNHIEHGSSPGNSDTASSDPGPRRDKCFSSPSEPIT